MQEHEFHIGDVLSAYTGILCGTLDGLYKILNYMTSDDLYTHQLPRAGREVRPYLLRQHPWLASIDKDWLMAEGCEDRPATCLARVEELATRHGAWLMVLPMPQDDHDFIDPLTELEQMRPKGSKIIPFEVPSDEESPSPTGDINWK